jgi:hypothetical protein
MARFKNILLEETEAELENVKVPFNEFIKNRKNVDLKVQNLIIVMDIHLMDRRWNWIKRWIGNVEGKSRIIKWSIVKSRR